MGVIPFRAHLEIRTRPGSGVLGSIPGSIWCRHSKCLPVFRSTVIDGVPSNPLVAAEKFTIYQGGIVFKEMQVKAEFSQRMDLRSYPFDKHKLVVSWYSNVYDSNALHLKLLNYETSWSVDPWLEGWDIESVEHYIGTRLR